jgi:transcriptional regulator with XRE-family HTH domain
MDAEREYGLALGRRIRDARRRLGLTQQDLGDEVNLSRTSITNIENGNQSVTVWLLHLIATATECSPADLVPSGLEERRSTLPTDVPPQTAALIRRLDAAFR